MLSNRAYFFIGKFVPLCAFIGIFPLTWDKKSRLLRRSPHGQHYLRYHVYASTFLVLFWLSQLFRFKFIQKSLDDFNLVYAFACAGFGVYQVLIIIWRNGEDVLVYSNMLLLHLRHINHKFLPSFNPDSDPLSLLFELGGVCLFCAFTGMGVIVLPFIFLFQDAPIFFYSVLPKSSLHSWVFAVVVHYSTTIYYCVINIASMLIFTLGVYLYAALICPFVFNEFRLGRKNYQYKSTPILRKDPLLFIKAYRSFEILHKQAITLIVPFIVPTQTLLTKLTVVSSFLLIRFGANMQLFSKRLLVVWGVGGALFWCSLLMLGGHIHRHGVKILMSWKRSLLTQWGKGGPLDHKMMRRFGRSCKPLMVNYGNAYVIRMSSVLKFIRGLSKGLTRMLLTLKKY